jgi:hypothetical protein
LAVTHPLIQDCLHLWSKSTCEPTCRVTYTGEMQSAIIGLLKGL